MAKRKPKPAPDPRRTIVAFDVPPEQHEAISNLAHDLRCSVAALGRALFGSAALNPVTARKLLSQHAAQLAAKKCQP